MRYLITIVMLMGVLSIYQGTVIAADKPSTSSKPVQLKTVILEVDNMTCGVCPITVRKALEKVPGVHKAQVDGDTNKATVRYDASKTNVKALTQATANAGYPSREK